MQYAWIYSALGGLILITILVLFVVRRRGVLLEGKVVDLNICRANFTTSSVTVVTSQGARIELMFDTVATIACNHRFGEQCFHGKGDTLDAYIQFGDILCVRTERTNSMVRDVRRFVSVKSKRRLSEYCVFK